MTSIVSVVVIGLLPIENKQFDHEIKMYFSPFDQTYFTYYFVKANSSCFISSLSDFIS